MIRDIFSELSSIWLSITGLDPITSLVLLAAMPIYIYGIYFFCTGQHKADR